MRETAIAERGGHAAQAQHMFAHDIVQLRGRNAGHHMRYERIEHFCGRAACAAHAGKAFFSMQLDRAVARDGGLFGVDGNILVHAHPYSVQSTALRDAMVRLGCAA